MISRTVEVSAAEFEQRTGWSIRREGACKEDRCVPLPDDAPDHVIDVVDLRTISERLNMPLIQDEAAGLWSLGPESGGRALTSAIAPVLELPDWRGKTFNLQSLRGSKVLLVAWASW
jgi:hypothetical protein